MSVTSPTRTVFRAHESHARCITQTHVPDEIGLVSILIERFILKVYEYQEKKINVYGESIFQVSKDQTHVYIN